MKKISILLALVLALSCCLFTLAACGDSEEASSPADTSSAETSSAATSSEKEESSVAASSEEAESSEPEESSVPEETSEPDETSEEEPSAGYDGDVIENKDGKNLALGKSYTGADASTHPDVAKYCANLTDGEKATDLATDEGVWFAYYYSDAADADKVNAPGQVGTFVLDLEAVYAVSSVKINAFIGNNWGILPPKSIKVEYSADGSSYSTLGTKSFTTPEENNVTIVELVEFAGDAPVAAQYIRVTVELQGIFAFFNEIEVY